MPYGKHDHDEEKQYLYHGIATREFERKFNLADHVEVTGAEHVWAWNLLSKSLQ
jgi:molecular chaperone IbpA